jgi:hypothetical protein
MNLRGHFPASAATLLLNLSATSAGWTDLDVGGATTSNRAVAIWLHVEVQESNPGGGVFAAFRKNGVTTSSRDIRVYPQVGGITTSAQIRVELDSSQVFEYQLVTSGDTSANLRLDSLGYEQRW